MRKSTIVLGMLLCYSPLLIGQKYRIGQEPPKPADPADFTIRVHISASHIRLNCSGDDNGVVDRVTCGYGLYVEATLDAKKVELWGSSTIGKQQRALLVPGDYMAQLAEDDHNGDDSTISRYYNLRLHDGTIWRCQLSGITE